MISASRESPPPDPSSITAQPVRVAWAELPLSCPRRGDTLWSLHPRVYLPIHETGMEQCPYCSTIYVLDMAEPDDPLYPDTDIERDHALAVERTRLEVDKPGDELGAVP